MTTKELIVLVGMGMIAFVAFVAGWEGSEASVECCPDGKQAVTVESTGETKCMEVSE